MVLTNDTQKIIESNVSKKQTGACKNIYKRRKNKYINIAFTQDPRRFCLIIFVSSIKLYILINTLFLNNKLHDFNLGKLGTH